ncbi:MAG: PTS sugar transporter subunit IIA [Candidatus Omnitrophota bacterium]|nr:MAG: PTS sugar transporter subunit IIA [Candidatus Omnitrophota bacterium]
MGSKPIARSRIIFKMRLSEYIFENQIIVGLKSKKKKEVLAELLSLLIRLKKISPRSKQKIISALLARERLGSTALGQGIAIPHTRLEIIKKPLIVVGISKQGIDFDSLDGEPVFVIFLILSPKNLEGVHLKILAGISKILRDKYFLNRLKEASKPKQVKELIKAQEKSLGR